MTPPTSSLPVPHGIGPLTAPATNRPDLDEIRYFFDGSLIHTGAIFAGTTVDQVLVLHDNFNNADNEVADWDNLVVSQIPEPASSVALLALGGLALRRRR